MKIRFYSICLSLLFVLTACSSSKSANHIDIYSGNDNKLIVSIDQNEKILKILDIINHYEDYDNTVEIDNPDYIVELSPVDSNNSSANFKFWIKDHKLIFLSPQLFDKPEKLSLSTYTDDEFLKILNSQ